MITVYPRNDYVASAGTLYQWDFGQRLKIGGVRLPDNYEVHYSTGGSVISEIGTESGVNIPDELLEIGEDIIGWVYVQNEETGKTIYEFKINVKKRAKPTDPREPIIPAEGESF